MAKKNKDTTKQGVRNLNSLCGKKRPKLEMPPPGVFGELDELVSDYDTAAEVFRGKY